MSLVGLAVLSLTVSCGSGGGGSDGGDCKVASDCPSTENECEKATCNQGTCGKEPVAAGTVAGEQTAGDCQSSRCDGKGSIATVADDTDVPADVSPCSRGSCHGGVPSQTPASAGTACGLALTCDGEGACVGCAIAASCPGDGTACHQAICSASGVCGVSTAADGTACDDGDPDTAGDVCTQGVCAGVDHCPASCPAIDACHLPGECTDHATGTCSSPAAPDGTSCDDGQACTTQDRCQAGTCAGDAIPGCSVYASESFEACPHGWSFAGNWECGAPSNVGPAAAHGGAGVLATRLAANYDDLASYATDTATSPTFDLTTATAPRASFWVWLDTKAGADGFNLKVSADGGASYQAVTSVAPAYDGVAGAEAAWSADRSLFGWQKYTADLTAYAGKTVSLRFAFRSDSGNTAPGVYIDDLLLAEPDQGPLEITSTSPLPDAVPGFQYQTTLTRDQGGAAAKWSITGGTNQAWLTLDPTTGVLSGKPTATDVGPVSIDVHVEDPAQPADFADQTLTLVVDRFLYSESFEGACPDGWTLLGDWQCGAPTNVGPAAAFDGANVLGTQIAGNYQKLDTWGTDTATSPTIDLTGVAHPTLRFWMWIDTEGSTYDGANLGISTDGSTFSVLTNVQPAYPLMIAGQPAWGGHQAALGWQLVTADLAAYAGQHVNLRFAFQSDASGTFPGFYVDQVMVTAE